MSFRLRFLGIFDTVASVGIQGGALGDTTGHMAWADPDAAGGVSIHPRIHHCEHLIAMHESRGSFPLDRATGPRGAPMANGREWAFPGAHSDVGGGYAPKAQGKSPTDADKLSQMALTHMYEAARKAAVPLDASRVMAAPSAAATGEGGDGYDSFVATAAVSKALKDFLAVTPHENTMQSCLLPWLAWQIRHLDDYQRLPFYQACKPEERKRIDMAQAQLRKDIARVRGGVLGLSARVISDPLSHVPLVGPAKQAAEVDATYALIDHDAYRRATEAPALAPAQEHLFGNYVHDSLAGFVEDMKDLLVEPTGRLHWRRIFYGDETPHLAQADGPAPGASAQASALV
ncbi:DUF2235 domain-containing protein [Roseateles sp.]|uniref:T6SS phospholipase effector Tle1-like catalytic domain-containing protein n=1 Tax=Roseateles sp. TaxID=1971397 RepID=UPI002E049DE1|nr:DUF2235 domain-containing protein [Roseateles sp.]